MGRAARFWRSREGALVLPALAFYVLVYLYPLSRIVGWSFFDPDFTLKFYRELLAEPAYFKALRNTLEISVLVTLISLMLGYPLAYLMTTTSARARRVLTVLILVPFWTSILVRTFAWLVILGNNGLVNRALLDLGLVEFPHKLLFNMVGVQVGMVHVLLPFMVFPLYGVMSRIDLNVVRVARSLGAVPRKAFLYVFLPLSLPGVGAGCRSAPRRRGFHPRFPGRPQTPAARAAKYSDRLVARAAVVRHRHRYRRGKDPHRRCAVYGLRRPR